MIKDFKQARDILAKFMPPAGTGHNAYSIERIRGLMDRLGNPQDSYKVIHVAGTSGKTSTCYFMASLLKTAGQKVGLTISPHIDEVNERVQINLKPLPEAAFCKGLSEFLPLVQKTGIVPTYFELLVAFAYWEFARAKVDYAVVEVGLGGLVDGTNVISRADKVCVITDIGLDHTHVLGKTLGEIATQKAGIIGDQNIVFSYPQPPEALASLQAALNKHKTHMHEVVISPKSSKLPFSVPLFQQRNWHLACAVYGYLAQRDELPDLSGKKLLATAKTYIPARMEVVSCGDKTLVLDGAHNAQKMEALAISMKRMFPNKEIAMMLSVVKQRDFRMRTNVLPLANLSRHVILTSFASQQDSPHLSTSPTMFARHLRKLGIKDVEIITEPGAAFAALLQRPEPILLITGSFYLMNHIRPLIFSEELKNKGKE